MMKWKKVRLGDVIKVRSGINLTQENMDTDGEYPVFGGNGITGWHSGFNIENSTIVIGRVGYYCGSVHLTPNKAWVTDNAFITKYSTDDFNQKYLFYALKKMDLRKFSNSSAQPVISGTGIASAEITVPPIHIQEQIANTLDKADALRRKDQELLTRYDDLAQAIFYDMFGDPVKNEKGWEIKKLIKSVQMKGGGTPNTSNEEYFNGDIPWVSPKDMKTTLISNSIDKITELAIRESSTALIEKNSVLMVVRSGILKRTLPLAINTVPVAINQDMKALMCEPFIKPIFLLYLLKTLSGNILSSVRGTTADNISSDVIKKIDLIIPLINEQKKFELRIKNIFMQKENLDAQLLHSELLFSTLLSNSFN